MASKCDVHGVPLAIRCDPEHPGKTWEDCPECEAEARQRLEELFRTVYQDKGVRDGE